MKKLKKNASKVTRIGVGRVYNLGNYENCRYELSVDVGDDAKPSRILRNLVHILVVANPKSPVAAWDVESAKKRLANPEEWHKNVTPEKERRRQIKQMVKEAKETVAKYEAWEKARVRALRLLDSIGMNIAHKDAKNDWDDWDEE